MKKFDFAILSIHDARDVVAVMTVYANGLDKAKKRLREDPDMQGARFYPIKEKQHHADEVGVAA